ncbi:MAG: tetratricopeptide repeat protein [Fimbriimonadaceae bacterium]
MSLPSLLFMLASLSPGAGHVKTAPPVSLKVDLAPGSTLSGERNFRVIVTTDEIVTKVEMYVGGERLAEAQSTPYRFTLDTINEKDGPVVLKWVAYTDQGHKGTTTIDAKIDNGTSLGADAHVQTGMKSLQDGQAQAAIDQGRIALKIDKKFAPARFLLARAYAEQGAYDKAQKYVQDVIDDDPANLDAYNVASAISLKQAFSIIGQGGQDMDALTTIGTAFKTAIDNRRKFVDGQFDAAAKNPSAVTAYADAAVNALRFSDAINVLAPAYKMSPAKADLADRLAYCQMRDGRYGDALQTLDTLRRIGANTSDAYAQALGALIQDRLGNRTASDSTMSDAELNDAFSVGVETAQASIALHRNDTSTSQSVANGLMRDQGQRTEVNYLLAALANLSANYQQERHYFELAVLAEPLNYDMYVEEANSAVKLVVSSAKKEDKDFQYAYAELMCKMALEAKNDSFQALTALALVNGLQGKAADAYKYAQAAADAQPNYAGGQFALSACANLYARAIGPKSLSTDDAQQQANYAAAVKRANELDHIAVNANNAAAKIDPADAGGRAIPTVMEAFDYFARYGRSPVISKPG